MKTMKTMKMIKTIYTRTYDSPIGRLTLTSDGEYLTGLWIRDMETGEEAGIVHREEKNLPVFVKTIQWLACYFNGEEPDFLPQIKAEGTEFQQSVWKILSEIPYGQVVTYGEIAKKIASERGKARMSAQAVGGAVGSNPVSILIPCHRVVGAKGNLTGYGGGLPIKERLLEMEGLDMNAFHMPDKQERAGGERR